MNEIARLLAPVARAARNMIARAVVRLVDDGHLLQELQVEPAAGEVLDGVEHWHAYGFSSYPLPGAEALLLSVGGTRGRAVVVAVADRRYRLQGLAAGEVAIHDDRGQSIVLRHDGIELTGQVRITGGLSVVGPTQLTGALTQTGALAVTGTASVSGLLTAPAGVTGIGGRSLDTAVPTHTHLVVGVGAQTGGPT